MTTLGNVLYRIGGVVAGLIAFAAVVYSTVEASYHNYAGFLAALIVVLVVDLWGIGSALQYILTGRKPQ